MCKPFFHKHQNKNNNIILLSFSRICSVQLEHVRLTGDQVHYLLAYSQKNIFQPVRKICTTGLYTIVRPWPEWMTEWLNECDGRSVFSVKACGGVEWSGGPHCGGCTRLAGMPMAQREVVLPPQSTYWYISWDTCSAWPKYVAVTITCIITTMLCTLMVCRVQ